MNYLSESESHYFRLGGGIKHRNQDRSRRPRTPNWPVALSLLLLHPAGTLYLLTFDCVKTFSLSNAHLKPICSNLRIVFLCCHKCFWIFGPIGPFIATQLNSTQLDVELSTRSQREQLSSINERIVTQLTQFVGHDVINKNTTDLAVRCSTGSFEFSWVVSL